MKISDFLLVCLLNRIGVLREIARGQGEVGAEWRARWKASKETGTPLFHGIVADWNPSQVALSYWFSFYDSIYEHPERPPQKIINNDDLLDKWVEDKTKEMEDRAKKSNSKYGGQYQPKGALDHEEVIVFDNADDDYYEIDEYDDVEFDGVDYEY
jgi:hypothetical protein